MQTGPIAAFGCFGSAFVYLAFHHSEANWIVWLRNLIRPRDRTFKTWRVALQAGLGAGLFGLIAIPEFQVAAKSSISLLGLLFLAVGTALSIWLIVPLHLQVTGEELTTETHDDDPHTGQPVATILRSALTFFVLLFVQYLHGAIEETIQHSQWAAAIITLGIVIAGVVTYHWRVALRTGEPFIRSVSIPTLVLGALCCLPFVLGIMYLVGDHFAVQPPRKDAFFLLVGLLVLVGLLSILAALCLFSSFAGVGAWSIRRSPPEGPKATYLRLGCGLISVAFLLQCLLALGVFLATGLEPPPN